MGWGLFMIRYHTVAKILMMAFLTMQVSSIAQAEIKEFSASATYTMSNYETLDIAQQRALREAERSALEQAGIYIESHTTVVNGKVVNDEVLAVASNVIRIKSKKFDKYFDAAKNLVTSASIVAEIDTDKVDKGLKREDIAELTKQYNVLKDAYSKQEKELMELKKQKTQSIETEKAMKRIDNKFLASEKIAEINKLLYDFDDVKRDNFNNNMSKYGGEKISEWLLNSTPDWKVIADEKKKRRHAIIDKCNELIALDAGNSDAYVMRGIAYMNYYKTLSNEEKEKEGNVFYQAALEDYTKAININPKSFEAYIRRGGLQNDVEEKIRDYTSAIEINPQAWEAYNKRARMYERNSQYDEAIKDRTVIIKNLNWRNESNKTREFYFFVLRDRADLYKKMGMLNEAVNDYSLLINDVCKEFNDLSAAMLRMDRAEVLLKMGKKNEAILDCDYVIASNWDKIKGTAYYLRALANLNDKNKFYEDCSTALRYKLQEDTANRINDFLGLPQISF